MEIGTRVYSAQFFPNHPPAAVWVIIDEDLMHYEIVREGINGTNVRVPKRCVYPVPTPQTAP